MARGCSTEQEKGSRPLKVTSFRTVTNVKRCGCGSQAQGMMAYQAVVQFHPPGFAENEFLSHSFC